MRIYVGNLPNGYRLSELISLFEDHACVSRATAIRDFAFLAIYDRDGALNAINSLNNARFGNNDIIVEPARFIRNRFGGYGGNGGRFYANDGSPGNDSQNGYYPEQGDVGNSPNNQQQQAVQNPASYQGDNQNGEENANYNNQQHDESQPPTNQPGRGRGRGRGRGQTYRRTSRNFNHPPQQPNGPNPPATQEGQPPANPTEPANPPDNQAPPNADSTPAMRSRGRGRGGRRGGRGRRGRGGAPNGEHRESTSGNQSAPPGTAAANQGDEGTSGGPSSGNAGTQRPPDVVSSIGGAGDGVRQPAVVSAGGKGGATPEKGPSGAGGGDGTPVTAAC